MHIFPKILPLLLLSACASLAAGSSQDIKLTSSGVGVSDCVLSNSRGAWEAKTPITLTLHRAGDDLAIRCDAVGGWHADLTVPASSRLLASTNAIMGLGAIGGVGIDMATGAAYQYPDEIEVKLTKGN